AKAPARAREALQSVRKRFPRTNAAAKAAYALGRIAFDTQRKYGAAATWFQTYLDERPSGALKREALGRLIESHRRSGASGPAKQAAQRYLDRYPDGPHADIARQAL
ncbi:MAG: tetratricopeptide repeat protein, partial [Myxococcota bacterium]